MQLLVVFKAAPELCDLLRTVEEEYTKAREQHKSRVEGAHADVLPWIQTQAAAFESAATATVRDTRPASAVHILLDPSWLAATFIFFVSGCSEVEGSHIIWLALGRCMHTAIPQRLCRNC